MTITVRRWQLYAMLTALVVLAYAAHGLGAAVATAAGAVFGKWLRTKHEGET